MPSVITHINLEKQIKRHLIARRQEYFAITHPGFEDVCRHELQSLDEGIEILETLSGGISFAGRLTDLYRANLHLRTAGRLLMRLAQFKAANFNQLVHHASAVPWERYLPSGVLPAVRVTTRHSRLFHSHAVADRLKDAIHRRWRLFGEMRPSMIENGQQSIWVRIEDDKLTISLDSSGANLYLRGLKTHSGRAPLRETMAAAILISAGFRPDRPLIDPMCGAGTFALEAALMSRQIPPGNFREFAFMAWPAFRERQWQHLKKAAQQTVAAPARPMIVASDIDEHACRSLSQCLSRHRLHDGVEVVPRDFFSFNPLQRFDPEQTGLVVLNPPYGRRLGLTENIADYYRKIEAHLTNFYRGWQAAVLAPASVRFRNLSLRTTSHGGLKLNLWVGTIC